MLKHIIQRRHPLVVRNIQQRLHDIFHLLGVYGRDLVLAHHDAANVFLLTHVHHIEHIIFGDGVQAH